MLDELREIASNNPVFRSMAEMIRIQAEISEMIRKAFAFFEDKAADEESDWLTRNFFEMARERLGPAPMFGPAIPKAADLGI